MLNEGHQTIDRNLSAICRNATNTDGDEFVGIKFNWNEHDSSFDIAITFPLGYRIGEDNETVRNDILTLVSTLHTYEDHESASLNQDNTSTATNYTFPIQAYIDVMYDYLDRGGYYVEQDEIYISSNSGRVNWNRTIRHERPIMQKNGVVYLNMQVKKHNETDRNLITEISKYCVYESFLKLGWLYKYSLPPKPTITFNKNLFLSVLREKLATTHKDRDKRLIQNMLDIILFLDKTSQQEQSFNFGTTRFEYVWERLIDSIFGIKNKDIYFPRATWELFFSYGKNNSALQPDTILKADDIVILDAKYYRYGETALASHLPYSSSINKQITYGEHIYYNYKDEHEVYNAFLMPFRKNHYLFSTTANYLAVGLAKSEWKKNNKPHELVLGVLVDVKHLMTIKNKPSYSEIHKLLEIIKTALH
ncbi:LlaJI family restriction endonuclease [Psychrobacter sp.]|uniref:LlaJI family restriction endonuclease n=1 Tax=Psychrobacter sp. TaxID=56811 RepID=UPI003F94DC20